MIKTLILFVILQAIAICASAQEYRYNWRSQDPDLDNRWTITSKDAELRYDWRKKKAGSENWQFVRPDDTLQYNWRKKKAGSENWEYAPKEK